ncbi:MAG: ligand-gated channel protein, partial [Myxococcota bacterium]
HNVNLGAQVLLVPDGLGRFRGELNLFLRETSELIVLLGTDRDFRYENVFAARSMGTEVSGGWASPGGWLSIDGNLTYVDFRNTSSEGPFEANNGDRVPNQPFLFANVMASARDSNLVDDGDELSLLWGLRFVGAFFRGWESTGLRQFKPEVPDQAVQFVSLRYDFSLPDFDLSLTGEVANLTDADAFDFFGVQKPGRSVFLKTVVGL